MRLEPEMVQVFGGLVQDMSHIGEAAQENRRDEL
jgi:hypothetical protein